MPETVDLRKATRVWAYVGLNSFGGPAGQIAVMHREVVDKRRWISERRFLHALNYCMVLPGPEAQQLATYIGWLMNGIRGGLVAGILFIVPGFIVMMALSAMYALYGQVGWVAGLLLGLQAAVLALVVQALIRMAGRTLHARWLGIVAVAAFAALFFFAVPFPIVIIVAGFVGWWTGRASGSSPMEIKGDQEDPGAQALLSDDETVDPAQARRALIAAACCLVLWLTPVVLLVVALGTESTLTQIALLFSKTAVLTFGGAYAILAYVSQQAVLNYGWITADDMTTGLGLAETTPGPLILVVQFVGFLAAYNNPGSLPPLLAGFIGAVITVWVTFVPCFMFIFAGAPFVDRLRHSAGLHHALSAIGAAVVGVIANLALWFALSTFFTVRVVDYGPLVLTIPQWSTLDLWAALIAAVAGVLVFRVAWPTLRVLAVCALLGVLVSVVG